MRRHFASTPQTCGGPWGESTLGKAPGPKHPRTCVARVCWAAGLSSNRHFYHLSKVPAPVVGLIRVQRWHGLQEAKQLVDWCREKNLMIVGFRKNQPSHAPLLANNTAVEVVHSTRSLVVDTVSLMKWAHQHLHLLWWMRRSYCPHHSDFTSPHPGHSMEALYEPSEDHHPWCLAPPPETVYPAAWGKRVRSI